MNANSDKAVTPIYYVGIDGGATNCRAVIELADGTKLAEGFGGSANPSHGRETVIQSIMVAIDSALQNLSHYNIGYQQLIVGAGLAGLHLPRYRKLMQEWRHPFYALHLTDDLLVATLGAHNGGDGAVVIVGTGYSALSYVAGKQNLIGGCGFLMADQCSGSWIGYQAIQAVMFELDGLGEKTKLTEILRDDIGLDTVQIAERYLGASASEYGKLAYQVFAAAELGDSIAQQILNQSRKFIEKVVHRLQQDKPPRITLVGGVAERMYKQLPTEFQLLLSPALGSPEQGAIAFAKSRHRES